MTDAQAQHLSSLALRNAHWHRDKYAQTKDRYHVGQWKSYARTAKCLRTLEAE